jgi:hypothetical protein
MAKQRYNAFNCPVCGSKIRNAICVGCGRIEHTYGYESYHGARDVDERRRPMADDAQRAPRRNPGNRSPLKFDE